MNARLSRRGQASTHRAQAKTAVQCPQQHSPGVTEVRCVPGTSAYSDTSNLHKSTSMSFDFCLQQVQAMKLANTAWLACRSHAVRAEVFVHAAFIGHANMVYTVKYSCRAACKYNMHAGTFTIAHTNKCQQKNQASCHPELKPHVTVTRHHCIGYKRHNFVRLLQTYLWKAKVGGRSYRSCARTSADLAFSCCIAIFCMYCRVEDLCKEYTDPLEICSRS